MVTQVPQLHVDEGVAKIKPHVKYWRHGLYFADADRVCSAGRSIPEAIERWHIRWSAMEAISPLARKKVRQYYYQVNGCKAKLSTDANCICWHDEGTGPLGDEKFNAKYGLGEIKLGWRDKP